MLAARSDCFTIYIHAIQGMQMHRQQLSHQVKPTCLRLQELVDGAEPSTPDVPHPNQAKVPSLSDSESSASGRDPSPSHYAAADHTTTASAATEGE